MQSELMRRWLSMRKDEREFVERVYKGKGRNRAAEPIWRNEDTGEPEPLWEVPEELGFVESTGSFSWVATSNYEILRGVDVDG